MSKAKTKVSKPWWWRPLWIGVILSNLVFGFIIFFLWHVPIERVISGVALALVCIGFAYYIRVRPSMKVNRALYIWLGVTPIGFGLWILYAVSGIGRWLTDNLGVWPSLIIGFTVPYIIGAYIGNWIGKRRNYHLPLSL